MQRDRKLHINAWRRRAAREHRKQGPEGRREVKGHCEVEPGSHKQSCTHWLLLLRPALDVGHLIPIAVLLAGGGIDSATTNKDKGIGVQFMLREQLPLPRGLAMRYVLS